MSVLYRTTNNKHDTLTHDIPTFLFLRLVAVPDRLVKLDSAFEFELTPEPRSLFDKGMERKESKSALLKEVGLNQDCFVSEGAKNNYSRSIVDGGALIHRVHWEKGATFAHVAKKHIEYVQRHYYNPTVIFDGYKSPSTKDQEHLRRCSIPTSRFVAINDDTPVPYSKEKYLTLKENKIETRMGASQR